MLISNISSYVREGLGLIVMKWLLKGSEIFFVTATSFFLDKRNCANSQQIALFQDQDESVYRVSGQFKFSVELAIYYHTDIRYWYLLELTRLVYYK